MTDLTPFLKQLLSLPGLSGNEAPVREVIAEKWRPLTDELSVSKLGSLHALKKATDPHAPAILFAAHMDAIGLMVTGITDGFLRITEIGGVDPRILPGQLVTVHGRRDLPGLAVLWPDRLVNTNHKNQPPSLERILIDTGLPAEDVNELVHVGDLVSFATQPVELSGGALSGHTLDNRASVAALTVCLEELQQTRLAWNLWMVATVQEEETCAGGITSPFAIEPQMAVAVDVTFAKGPGASDYRAFPMGKGPTIGTGANIHPYLFKTFKVAAEKYEIPFAVEPLPKGSGTDAVYMQVVAGGIPSAVIGIPLRYMHTPVEEVVLDDIQRTGRLLAEFVKSLAPDTLETLTREMHP
jgi:Cellulase M and related proteins